MNEEQEHLNDTLNMISDELNEELEIFDDLQYRYRREPERFGIAYKVSCDKIKRLKNGILKPYFARIDFAEKSKETNQYYIGKYSIEDEKDNVIVVDWRAPIANLYYDSEIGSTSYECPDGIIDGDLILKRQFEIEDGKLINYHDVDIVSNDKLLQKYLEVNNEMRLKNIVSTIQKEQNYAIRKPLRVNTIIQGVAGSGKTTIALHRIAYLVYNYRDIIRNNQYMVIGPNDVFLKYIQSVLPDLDVSDVKQLTYEDLVKEVVEEDFEIKPSYKTLNKYLVGKLNDNISKFRNSEEFKIMIDLFLDDYFDNVIVNGLMIKDYTVISKDKLKQIYLSALKDSNDFSTAIERFVLLVDKYVTDNKDVIISNLNKLTNNEFNNATSEKEKNGIKEKTSFISSEIQKGCKQTSRKLISKYNLTPTKLYKLFLNNIDKYDVTNYQYLKELQKDTLKNINDSSYDFEDLAALMHFRYRLGINKEFKNYKHVVIDEAQDFGVFNFYTLRECLPNATFSIYGDITQSIYDYRSIDSWDEVMKIFDNSELISFKKSYRTTDEIMNVANSVSDYLDLGSSELSIRHGSEVSFSKVDVEDVPRYIKEKINEYKEKKYKTIAIISKYPVQSNYINDDLSLEGICLPNVDEGTNLANMDVQVLTISNYLAKGLEFDAVILNDVSENIYDSNRKSDMKMLYVALTRALHEMDVIYTNEITKPLAKFVEKEKQYALK